MVTCEIKLFWNYLRSWLHLKQNSEIILKLFQPLKEFQNYFKIISATLNMLENIQQPQ